MACNWDTIPENMDELIANAAAVAIVCCNSADKIDYRNASSIIDIIGKHYKTRTGSSLNTRRTAAYVLPLVLHIHLVFSARNMRGYLTRIYSLQFLRSRATDDCFFFKGIKYQSYLMKTVGNSSILNTPENIEIIKCDVLHFINSQRLILLLPDSRCIHNDGFSTNNSTNTAPVVNSDTPMRETPTRESTIIASFNTPDNTDH